MKSMVGHEGLHCGTLRTGGFCHDSGQSVYSVLKPMHHLVEETVQHIDSRIVRTLEYSVGRRMR